jgi:hypothetical protein
MDMTPEELLRKRIAGGHPTEDGRLLVAASLVNAEKTKELANASILLAQTTQTSAESLAKTTKASAELLAKTTKESAEALNKLNEISVRQMRWLTLVLVAVGFTQIILAVLTLIVSWRLK